MSKKSLLELRDTLKSKIAELDAELDNSTRKKDGKLVAASLKRSRKLTLEIGKIGKDFRALSTNVVDED